MATTGWIDAPGPDGGPGNPRGNKVCSQRAKETFFHLHRWLMRTKRKICTEGNPGHPGWGDPGFYIRNTGRGGEAFSRALPGSVARWLAAGEHLGQAGPGRPA